MNDALRQELSIAIRCFAQSSTADVRRAVASARQLDRSGEVERRLRLIEAGCLVRDHQKSAAERSLMALGRITAEDWAYLDRLLLSAPERQYAGFEQYRLQIRSHVEANMPGAAPNPPSALSRVAPPAEVAVPVGAMMNATNGNAQFDWNPPAPATDGLALTSMILGILSILLGLPVILVWVIGPVVLLPAMLLWALGPLALLPGIVGIVLSSIARSRGGVRIAGLVLSIVGTTMSVGGLVYLAMFLRNVTNHA
jgi:hypothetical protein